MQSSPSPPQLNDQQEAPDRVVAGSQTLEKSGDRGIVRGLYTEDGKAEEEIHTFFANLSSGGEIGHPLEEVFFGTFGELTDKFGMNWMFQFDKNSQA